MTCLPMCFKREPQVPALSHSFSLTSDASSSSTSRFYSLHSAAIPSTTQQHFSSQPCSPLQQDPSCYTAAPQSMAPAPPSPPSGSVSDTPSSTTRAGTFKCHPFILRSHTDEAQSIQLPQNGQGRSPRSLEASAKGDLNGSRRSLAMVSHSNPVCND